MTVQIDLSPELESQLRSRAAEAGQDVETFATQILANSFQNKPSTSVAENRGSEDFRKKLTAWIALHPQLDHPIDDSRESIYAGCGE